MSGLSETPATADHPSMDREIRAAHGQSDDREHELDSAGPAWSKTVSRNGQPLPLVALPPHPDRRSFLHEGPGPFLGILAPEDLRGQLRLDPVRIFHVGRQSPED